MFSHQINNPNNLVIITDSYVIPFGYRCSSALACKYADIRKFSLPFDWSIPLFPKKIQMVLENNFTNFIPDISNSNDVFVNKYNIFFPHFNSNTNDGIEEYKRRIKRFNDILNQSKKKIFVYINEDYLYDSNFRQDEFNGKIFNEMLELEKFIKDKYVNIDYIILYFNFTYHNIPTNSNIINIVLHTTNLYNAHNEAPYNKFRIYCGKILSELFNTTLNLSNDINIFND